MLCLLSHPHPSACLRHLSHPHHAVPATLRRSSCQLRARPLCGPGRWGRKGHALCSAGMQATAAPPDADKDLRLARLLKRDLDDLVRASPLAACRPAAACGS